jgi:hypothetical protein
MLLMLSQTVKLGIVAALSMCLAGCGDPCSSELVSAMKSPSGGKEAGFFRANCGATTGYAYEVRISGDGPVLTGGKTVLRFDDNHARDWPKDERQVVGLSWSGDNKLNVTVSQPVRVFKEEGSSQGVDVRFQFRVGTVKL